MAYGMQQVGLAQANATIKEKGIVDLPRILCHCQRGCVSELIGFTYNKCIKGIAWDQQSFAVTRERYCSLLLLLLHRLLPLRVALEAAWTLFNVIRAAMRNWVGSGWCERVHRYGRSQRFVYSADKRTIFILLQFDRAISG